MTSYFPTNTTETVIKTCLIPKYDNEYFTFCTLYIFLHTYCVQPNHCCTLNISHKRIIIHLSSYITQVWQISDFDPRINRGSSRSRFTVAPRGKSYSRASKPVGLTAFRVIPIQTKYPRALSSCIMHTHRQQKQPPPFTAGLDSPRPEENGVLPRSLFLSLFLRPKYFMLFYCVATQ